MQKKVIAGFEPVNTFCNCLSVCQHVYNFYCNCECLSAIKVLVLDVVALLSACMLSELLY